MGPFFIRFQSSAGIVCNTLMAYSLFVPKLLWPTRIFAEISRTLRFVGANAPYSSRTRRTPGLAYLSRRGWSRWPLGLAATVFVGAACAHQSGTSQIDVKVRSEAAQTVVSVIVSAGQHDLMLALGVPVSMDEPMSARVLEARMPAVERYIKRHFGIAGRAGQCRPEDMRYVVANNPEYIDLHLEFHCAAPMRWLLMGYGLFFNLDPEHIAVGRLLAPAAATQDLYFDATVQKLVFEW